MAGCSDTDQTPKPPWRERKEAYLAHLRGASPSVRLISAADKLDNVRSLLNAYPMMGESLWERFNGRRDGTLWYFHSVVKTLREAGSNALVEQLATAVEEFTRTVSA